MGGDRKAPNLTEYRRWVFHMDTAKGQTEVLMTGRDGFFVLGTTEADIPSFASSGKTSTEHECTSMMSGRRQCLGCSGSIWPSV